MTGSHAVLWNVVSFQAIGTLHCVECADKIRKRKWLELVAWYDLIVVTRTDGAMERGTHPPGPQRHPPSHWRAAFLFERIRVPTKSRFSNSL